MNEGNKVIPRGVEVLLKKAAVDSAFKAQLLAQRAEAAATIGLTLEPSEVLLLQSVAAEHLEAIIARTTVPKEHRRAFLGQVAATMLAALGTITFLPGCAGGSRPSDSPGSSLSNSVTSTGGSRPDRPPDRPSGTTQPQGQ